MPVDCANRPLFQLIHRRTPEADEVVVQAPEGGEGFSIRDVHRTDAGVELALAESDHKHPSTTLTFQLKDATWLRDGKPVGWHPFDELARWRVRRACGGTEGQDSSTVKPARPGEEFQGLPPKPKLAVVPFAGSLPTGFPMRWIEFTKGEEKVLEVGCAGELRNSWLELRDEDGKLILDQPYLPYVVTRVRRGPDGVRLSLANPATGAPGEELEIRYQPGAAEAVTAWTDVPNAETETRAALTLEAAQKLPRRVACEQ